MKKIDKSIELKIVKEYSIGDKSIEDIALKYNVHSSTVNRSLSRSGIVRERSTGPRNKIEMNNNFFSVLDNEEKSYWAGFILADGCLRKTKNGSFELKIVLALKDVELLYLFKKHLESKHMVRIFNQYSKKTKKTYKRCSLVIVRKKIVKDLIENGIFIEKSHKIEIPNLTRDNMRHFIRGLFDGDGGWCIRRNSLSFTIRSSCTGFLEKIQNILNKECGISKNKIGFNTGAYKLGYEGNIVSKKFFVYLYKDCSVFLKRKKEYSQKHLEKLGNKLW